MGDVESAYRRSVESPIGLLRAYCEYALSVDLASAVRGPRSRAILEAAAAGDGGIPTYSAMARALSVDMRGLPRYVRPLVDAGLLDDGNGFAVRDRVLRDYLRACAARRESGRPPRGALEYV